MYETTTEILDLYKDFASVYTTCGYSAAWGTAGAVSREIITVTQIITIRSKTQIWVNQIAQKTPEPQCKIGPSDCGQLFSEYGSSFSSLKPAVAIATISLANPPNMIVVNGRTMTAPQANPTGLPALNLNGELIYAHRIPVKSRITGANQDVGYIFPNRATNHVSEDVASTLIPGEQITWTQTQLQTPPLPSCSMDLPSAYPNLPCGVTYNTLRLLYFLEPERSSCVTEPAGGPITSLNDPDFAMYTDIGAIPLFSGN